jgi:cellulose 1,4-beta-cellobiosidase
MFQSLTTVRETARARLLRGCCKALLALPFTLAAGGAFAQHVTNPFVGATQYVNPDYANEVNAVIAQTSSAQLKAQMTTVAGYPTAIWLDKMAAITGGSANSGRLSLAQHINAALAQQQGSEPVVITLVIYDLPQRDCAALASNGEISIAANPPSQPLPGLQTYEQNYITPIYNALAPYANNPNLRFVLVIEPDSLPNLITNTGLSYSIPACVAANGGQGGTASLNSVYAQGVTYALNQFHTLPNVYQYLDIGHSGWLGWSTNMGPAVSFYSQLVGSTKAGYSSIDGFISNTANYTPTLEPFMTADETIEGSQVYSANFYQYNPYIDEADYDAALYTAFTNAGFPSSIGFLIDTSRNGWGGPQRPTGPSGAYNVNSFVDASKIDLRNARGQWCNQSSSGMGAPPTARPVGYFSQLEAFVWIKPPGESDGTYATSSAYTGGNADENCDPTHYNYLANNTLTGALANPPASGQFFPAAFTMLVQNASPPIPAATTTTGSGSTGSGSTGKGSGSGSTGSGSTGSGSTGSGSTGSGSTGSGSTGTGSTGTGSTGTGSTGTGSTGSGSTGSGSTGSGSTGSGSTGSGSTGSGSTGKGTGTGSTGSGSTGSGSTGSGSTGSGSTGSGSTGSGSTTPTPTPSFTIVDAPASLSLMQGNSGSATITLTPAGGFKGTVAYAISGLPSGVTATFGAVSASGGTVVTINAGASAATGAGVLTITGTSGTLHASTTLSLTVTAKPTPSFTLASSAASLSLVDGGKATSTIAIVPSGGFNSAVALAVTGLPAGVSASFSPATTTSASTLTLAAASNAGTGSFTATIVATSGSLTKTETIPVTVTAPAPTGGTGPISFVGRSATNGAWYDEDDVVMTMPSQATGMAMTLTITVPATNVVYGGQYDTVGGQVAVAHTVGSNIVYTYTLSNGQTMWPGSYTFAAQMDGNGKPHTLAGDAWTATYTLGGVTYTQSGVF